MIGLVFFLFGILATLGMCALGALSDYKGFKIPNYISLIIIGAFAAAFMVLYFTGQAGVVFSSLSSHLLAALVVFAATLAMFAARILGAGDSKLATAVALWLGFPGLAAFLFYMTLAGGLLAGATILMRKYKPFQHVKDGTWPARAQAGADKLPYGIAIALGALAAFIFLGYLSPGKWAAIAAI